MVASAVHAARERLFWWWKWSAGAQGTSNFGDEDVWVVMDDPPGKAEDPPSVHHQSILPTTVGVEQLLVELMDAPVDLDGQPLGV